MEKATFGAGCFWGVEVAFRRLEGVKATTVGYLGGALKDPTYQDVCSGQTGHAEVVEVTFDPALVDYQALLDLFWACHDPTTLNRQGPDMGTQYRSAIFFHGPEQKAKAEASIDAHTKAATFANPIVTEVTATSTFYAAEAYHQQYLEKRGMASCHIP
ncbi:MAG: peptide-methionine (S)-S-oxide reductase MsrA [Rhodospirillaceae bacterium]|jgi:peptide-methionine (S)-S-oxide reductase|nr:peptide-methionine (S)-S-oxide reductase MsrA [Rhodospirillaceae bacterium]MBT5244499.1 peptide-methionine (S)-S-oxide reductase MsrA [Rhodospirillaceae bacterium]MBT5560756.1 peptide-methionine (S)-S-oxide reductase MsrA [Rhodospirillaceae bacterium]MBT6241595.1 peptide-methionine (S)-S-oxide reductase MsrA [Rhodospirillaceae bacterium]MBT7136381.1 peptide-methionine (S)-S-oxide reductase MsrA [Rhodospirillaceae bacterium]